MFTISPKRLHAIRLEVFNEIINQNAVMWRYILEQSRRCLQLLAAQGVEVAKTQMCIQFRGVGCRGCPLNIGGCEEGCSSILSNTDEAKTQVQNVANTYSHKSSIAETILQERRASWRRMLESQMRHVESRMIQCPHKEEIENGCADCPVKKYTGKSLCAGTSWSDATIAFHEWESATGHSSLSDRARKRFKYHAKKMYDLLDELYKNTRSAA